MPEHTSVTSTAETDEYLEAVYKLGNGEVPAAVPDLAERLGISTASANEMVRKLTQRGLVVYAPYKGVSLTDEGRAQALSIIRRHRLWERFLTDILHLPWDQVHAEACRLEHATSPAVEAGLDSFLNGPATCPHGHAMPSADGNLPEHHRDTIADMQPGQAAIVLDVPEEDSAVLRYLDSLHLRPGNCLTVVSTEPFSGPVTIQVENLTRAISYELAAQIEVQFLGGAN